MVGELIQGIKNELSDPNDASDPLNTVGRFVGAGIAVGAWGEMLEIAGDMEGGLAGLVTDPVPQPAMDPQLNTTVDPMMASGPSFGKPFA